MDVHRLPLAKISTVAGDDPTMTRGNTGLLLLTTVYTQRCVRWRDVQRAAIWIPRCADETRIISSNDNPASTHYRLRDQRRGRRLLQLEAPFGRRARFEMHCGQRWHLHLVALFANMINLDRRSPLGFGFT